MAEFLASLRALLLRERRLDRPVLWMAGCMVLALGLGKGAPTGIDPRYFLYDSAEIPAVPADGALIILVREQIVRTRRLAYERVYLDEIAAGLLPQQSWMMIQVEAGPHRISGIASCPDLVFDCRPGRTYLLRLREVIDSMDRRTVDLLFEDPTALSDLIEWKKLKYVETRPPGMAYLEKTRRSAESAADARRLDVCLPGSADTLHGILCEKPLDPVNLQREFSLLSAKIVLDDRAIHYRLDDSVRATMVSWRYVRDFFDIPREEIVIVRFDGTRFTGVTPWVNIVYRSPQGYRTVSFADVQEVDGVRTYNRIFCVAQEFLDATREARDRMKADSLDSVAPVEVGTRRIP